MWTVKRATGPRAVKCSLGLGPWAAGPAFSKTRISGPQFFNIFLNDLHTASINNLSFIKFANYSSLLIAVNEQIDNLEIALL